MTDRRKNRKELKVGELSKDGRDVWDGECWLGKELYESGQEMIQAMRKIKVGEEMY